MGVGKLRAVAAARDGGPVITLAGEADMTSAGRLDAVIRTQLAGGAANLTIDASGLRFADSSAVKVLAMTARTLAERGGALMLLDPQPPVIRILELSGISQLLTIRRTMRRRDPYTGSSGAGRIWP